MGNVRFPSGEYLGSRQSSFSRPRDGLVEYAPSKDVPKASSRGQGQRGMAVTLNQKTSIVGGAGHVGFPMGLSLANNDHDVTLIDQNEDALRQIDAGQPPFNEPGCQELLDQARKRDRLSVSSRMRDIASSDNIVLVIGTPIDEHNNPEMGHLLDVIEEMEDDLKEDQLLVLRSTVYPGTTSLVRDHLEGSLGFDVGEDFYLVNGPERVAQHKALDEMVNLPQLIGAFDDGSYDRAQAFFDSFIESECLRLNPAESELGKLFTNMWRYIQFAVANELFLIADSFGQYHDVNVHRVLDQTAQDYHRFNVPRPGANVGGPCLTKDGWFLVDNIPYNEFVTTAFQINEGMPAQIIEKMSSMSPNPDNVKILGATFKADSDDTRNSLAFKLKKQLRLKGQGDASIVEPELDDFGDLDDLQGADWAILMTPHSSFKDLDRILEHVDNPECLYSDVWGHWEAMRHHSQNGFFFGHQARDILPLQEGAR